MIDEEQHDDVDIMQIIDSAHGDSSSSLIRTDAESVVVSEWVSSF